MTRSPFLLVAALLCLSAPACSDKKPTTPVDPFAVRQLPESIRADAAQVVEGNNQFAIALYRQIKGQPGNLFFSPFSISTAFAMAYGGARGQTEAEMSRVFRFPLPQDPLHPAFQALLTSLNTGIGLEGYRLDLANRLWGQAGFAILPAFLALTREQYAAGLESVDFQADPEAARRRVNQWVAEATQERIKDLLPEGSVDRSTVLVLANAIYFKGKWQLQFDPRKTQDLTFHLNSSQDVTVPTMSMTAELAAASTEGVQVLELPYRGRDLSMLILLPTEIDGLSALEERLTLETLDGWRQKLQKTEMKVYLPRFEVTSQSSLRRSLSDMGMPTAFTAGADFTGISQEGGIFISDAFHKAFVKVNEEGTEAAAATGIVMGKGLPPEFRFDHPFVFLIRDNVTGSILFLGRVVDPSV